eukprot:TRINITY_DN872_c0_g1_i1.p1 TRINITY_DN872_c0_g1~~TRINITY_DN872_c0_g1_i1.p1  ORF type:complete len:520 (+),score=96.44 TRINITY_DN872_c0_g1_i1:17-1576(+)
MLFRHILHRPLQNKRDHTARETHRTSLRRYVIKKNIYSHLDTKTKIVATLGPASSSDDIIEKLVRVGADVVRLNFSHGDNLEKEDLIQRIQAISVKHLDQLSILVDIQGPKIRTGEMESAFSVVPGDMLKITPDEIIGSSEKGIQIRYPTLLEDLGIGSQVFVNDGIVKLTVVSKEGRFLVCEVNSGGEISDRKGCNIPTGKLSIDIITEKDEEDLKLIAKLKPDFIAASFVGDARDVELIRRKLGEYGNHHTRIISKIERPIAVDNIDEIIRVSDGIMVARGDLGVEIDTWLVPAVQKEICRKCNEQGKPVIVATQMLESMTKARRPTRAEASDVFNAVLDGADAVMLSGETSVGIDPVHTVSTMDTIIKNAEVYCENRNFQVRMEPIDIMSNSIFHMASNFEKFGKKGMVVLYTGKNYQFPRYISSYRPPLPIVAVASDASIVRQLNLFWGIRAITSENSSGKVLSIYEKAAISSQKCSQLNLLKNQDFIIFGCRTPENQPSVTLYDANKFLEIGKQ